jgi:hypothetical protein
VAGNVVVDPGKEVCLDIKLIESVVKMDEIKVLANKKEKSLNDLALSQKKIPGEIIDKEADYVLMVKDNQPELKQQVAKLFRYYKTPCSQNETVESGHGRVENRKCEMIGDLRF